MGSEKKLIAYNFRKIIEEKKQEGMTIEQIAKDAKVNKKTIYEIMEGKVKPREKTLDKLGGVLGFKNERLKEQYENFDTDFFVEQIINKLKEEKKEKDKKEQKKDVSENYDLLNYDEDFFENMEKILFVECGMNAIDLMKHKMPDVEIQQKVAARFRMNTEDLFRPINRISFATIASQRDPLINISRLNILSAASIDMKKMLAMFNGLKEEYRKIIYNEICDMYVASNQKE